jgi:hypothetical protein
MSKDLRVNFKSKFSVRKFLIRNLISKDITKDKFIYKSISLLHKYYPKTIKSILINLDKITNYQDYFFILEYSKDEEVNRKIMKILIDQFNLDAENLKHNKTISTLAKWMPREGSGQDKRLDHFVEKFCKIVYYKNKNDDPNNSLLDINTAKNRYRKTIAQLRKYIDYTERHLDPKDLQNLDYSNVTNKNFELYYDILWKNTEKMYDYLDSRYSRFYYLTARLVKLFELQNRDKYKQELEYLQIIWDKLELKYMQKYQKDLEILKDHVLLIDISASHLDNNKYDLIRLYLLFLYSKNKKVIINKKNPQVLEKQNSLIENIEQLFMNMSPCNMIDIQKIQALVPDKKILCITDKNDKIDNVIKWELCRHKLDISKDNIYGSLFFGQNKSNYKPRRKLLKQIINSYELKLAPLDRPYTITKLILIFYFIIMCLVYFINNTL